jgi:hypothetical protein
MSKSNPPAWALNVVVTTLSNKRFNKVSYLDEFFGMAQVMLQICKLVQGKSAAYIG